MAKKYDPKFDYESYLFNRAMAESLGMKRPKNDPYGDMSLKEVSALAKRGIEAKKKVVKK